MTLRVLGDIFSASINHGALRRSSSRASRRGRSLAERAQRIAHSKSRTLRSRPAEKSKLVMLFVLLLFSPAPASADDLIAQWLRQNEGAQTDEARQDLNALTDERWNEIFKIGLEQPDAELGRLLLERGRETPTQVLSLWLAALVVACGLVIGGVKARQCLESRGRGLRWVVGL